MTRWGIVGSRGYPRLDLVDALVQLLEPGDIVVTGGARGVDTHAEIAARMSGLQVIVHLPEWDRLGKRAGFERNKLIVDQSDIVVAFWDGESRGTKHSIELAASVGKLGAVFGVEEAYQMVEGAIKAYRLHAATERLLASAANIRIPLG